MVSAERKTPVAGSTGSGTKEDPKHFGRTIGFPDGPPEYRPEFGFWVRGFTRKRPDLDDRSMKSRPCLMFHVPTHLRGTYKPHELADFDPDYEYMTNGEGYAYCEVETLKGEPCRRLAENRQIYCTAHGGRLHPLDKTDNVALAGKDPALMSRFELLQTGYIDVEDLTDDELRNGLAGSVRGARFTVDKTVYQKIVTRHFQRAQELLAENLLPAIQALTHISQGSAYEPADRIKASVYIIDRVLGKTPDVIKVGADDKKEPWEKIVESVMEGGSREESRKARGFVDGEVLSIEEAEVVDEGQHGESRNVAPVDVPEPTIPVQREPQRQPPPTPERPDVAPDVSPKSAAELKAERTEATKKRYKARAAGRSTVEPEPIPAAKVVKKGKTRIVKINAPGAENVTLGEPGKDTVS